MHLRLLHPLQFLGRVMIQEEQPKTNKTQMANSSKTLSKADIERLETTQLEKHDEFGCCDTPPYGRVRSNGVSQS